MPTSASSLSVDRQDSVYKSKPYRTAYYVSQTTTKTTTNLDRIYDLIDFRMQDKKEKAKTDFQLN